MQRWLAAGGLSFLLLAGCQAQPRAGSALRNGGFEAGARDWTIQADEQGSIQLDDADFVEGGHGLRVTHKAGAKKSLVRQVITLAPDSQYTLAVWIKTETTGAGGVALAVKSQAGALLAVTANPFRTASRWREQLLPFRTDASGKAEVVLSFAGADGRAWFDQIRVVPGFLKPRPKTAAAPARENLARGKPYVFSHKPDYSYCTDAGDQTDLTDGVYTSGYFWTQKSTVGWRKNRGKPISITIDLGKVEPLGGISYNSAAGVANVYWPASVSVLVSEDNKRYYYVGELTELAAGKPPAPGKYGVFRYRTTSLKTKGRFVRLAIVPVGNYSFTDEIEVYRGDEAALSLPYPGQPLAPDDLRSLIRSKLIQIGCKRRFEADRQALRERLEAANISARAKSAIAAGNASLAAEVSGFKFQGDAGAFKAIVPFNDLHRRIFALHARILAAEGAAPLTVWHKHRYAPLDLLEKPAGPRPALEIRAMLNEHRAEAINLTNASPQAMVVRLQFQDLPGGTSPPYLKVYQCEYVDTREGIVVASALPEMRREGDFYVTTVPAGMTRQVWFSFNPRKLPPGAYAGTLTVTAGSIQQRVPLRLSVSGLRFPDRVDLASLTWDYVDRPLYGLTKRNRLLAVQDMKAHFVNVAVGKSTSMPRPRPEDVDEKGNLKTKLDTSAFDAWVKLWPGAEYYQIFLSCHPKTSFAGKKRGTEAFARALEQWAAAWGEHVRAVGMRPGQVQVHFIDEPHTPEQFKTLLDWAKAFKAGTSMIHVFNDPTTTKPTQMKYAVEALSYCDVICPLLRHYNETDAASRDFYQKLRQQGKQLWFYMCSGPNRHFDPVYFRLQPWHCFAAGATGSGFWAYADTGGVPSSWNGYIAIGGTSYAPVYVTPESITTSKHWEAFREGVEDYQYFRMLAARVAAARKQGLKTPLLTEAERVLATLAPETLARAKKEGGQRYSTRWSETNPSRLADAGRLQVLALLEKLAGNK